ncbi:MAG: hypothetical protein R3Y62_05830 [Eubacteriales bacterium]
MNFENLAWDTITETNLKVYNKLISVENSQYLQRENAISFGCVVDGIPAVALIAVANRTGVELVWLQVHGLFRRRGLGRFALGKLAKKAKALGVFTLELDYVLDQPQRDIASRFFTACGFSQDELVGHFVTCPFSAMMSGAVANQDKPSQHEDAIYTLSELPKFILENGDGGIPLEAQSTLQVVEGKVLLDYSLAYVHNEAVVASVVLSAKGTDLYFDGFYCVSGHMAGLVDLIFTAASKLRQNGAPFHRVCLVTVTPMSDKMVDRLLWDLPVVKLPSYHRELKISEKP